MDRLSSIRVCQLQRFCKYELLGIGLQKYVFAVENKISRHQTLFRIGEERVILKINYKAETLT